MQLVALALLILIPLVMLIAGTALKRTPMLMLGGIAAFGVGCHCFVNTASAAGEYTDIWAVMGAVNFLMAAYGFTGRFWISEKEEKMYREETETLSWADEYKEEKKQRKEK